MNQIQSVLIIGGGLIGLSLALGFQKLAKKKALKIRVVDPYAIARSYHPSFDARSTAISLGSRQIFEKMGIWDSIQLKATPIQKVHVSEQHKPGIALLSAKEMQVPALGYVVENSWMGDCLYQAVQSDCPEWFCQDRVLQLQPTEKGYQAFLESGTSIQADLVVIADGGRSKLRESLGIHIKRKCYGQSAIICNVLLQQCHQGWAFERFTSKGPLALLPLDEKRSALVWSHGHDEAHEHMAMSDQDFLNHLQKVFGFRLGRLIKVGERHCYTLTADSVQEQARPHLVVMGNAAHTLHPVAGQGFNLALRDIDVLMNVLKHSNASVGSLTDLTLYANRQKLDQWQTQLFCDQLIDGFQNKNAMVAKARGVGLSGLNLATPLKHWFVQQAMGLGSRKP